MRAWPLSLAVLWIVAAVSSADLVIVQKVEGGGQAGEQTIKIKGDKARADLAQQVSVITDGATGGMTTLMHQQKSFLKVTPAQTKAMMEQLQKARPNSEPSKLEPTGKKEKIGEYECEIFTVNLGSLSVTYWLAKDFPNYPTVLAQLEKFQAGAVSAMGQGLMPELKEFPGMVMKTEMNAGGKKIVTTLVSAKEDNVDPGVFNIPSSYKEVSTPTLTLPPPK
jgi:hypothetical protein